MEGHAPGVAGHPEVYSTPVAQVVASVCTAFSVDADIVGAGAFSTAWGGASSRSNSRSSEVCGVCGVFGVCVIAKPRTVRRLLRGRVLLYRPRVRHMF